MGHSCLNSVISHEKFNATTECGLLMIFNSIDHRDIWIKLHRKKCPICNIAKITFNQPLFLKPE